MNQLIANHTLNTAVGIEYGKVITKGFLDKKLKNLVIVSVISISLLALSAPAEAKSIIGSLGGAAVTRLSAKRAISKKVPINKPYNVIIPRKKYPETAAHIKEAQRLGQPSVLTLDRAGAKTRRRESMKYIDRPRDRRIHKLDRDEYPPAMTREGGSNADVRYINAGDNRGSGRSMAHQVRDLPNGARIHISVKD